MDVPALQVATLMEERGLASITLASDQSISWSEKISFCIDSISFNTSWCNDLLSLCVGRLARRSDIVHSIGT